MSHAVLLQHDPLYTATRIVSVFRDFGIPCDVRRLFAGDTVPAADSDTRMLILLGGRQRVGDVGSAQHPFLSAELEVARRFVEADRPIVGIGFGAELMSLAGGAKVLELRKPGPTPQDPPGEATPEMGWYPITLPFPGGTEPLVFGLADGACFFMWHRDGFAMPSIPPPANPPPPPARPPSGSVLIASTRLCRTQAYRFKQRVLGFQFHFELDQASIEQIITERGPAEGLSPAQVEQLLADTRRCFPRYDRLSHKLLENIVQFTRSY